MLATIQAVDVTSLIKISGQYPSKCLSMSLANRVMAVVHRVEFESSENGPLSKTFKRTLRYADKLLDVILCKVSKATDLGTNL